LAWLPTSVRPRASPPPCLPWSFHLLELELELVLAFHAPWTGRFRVVVPFFRSQGGRQGVNSSPNRLSPQKQPRCASHSPSAYACVLLLVRSNVVKILSFRCVVSGSRGALTSPMPSAHSTLGASGFGSHPCAALRAATITAIAWCECSSLHSLRDQLPPVGATGRSSASRRTPRHPNVPTSFPVLTALIHAHFFRSPFRRPNREAVNVNVNVEWTREPRPRAASREPIDVRLRLRLCVCVFARLVVRWVTPPDSQSSVIWFRVLLSPCTYPIPATSASFTCSVFPPWPLATCVFPLCNYSPFDVAV
jgi:hypothetical protein